MTIEGGTHQGRHVGRRTYQEAVKETLIVLWEASDRICVEGLLPSSIEAMERHEHSHLEDGVMGRYLAVSAATIDRLLRPVRERASGGKKRKSSPLNRARKMASVRTFADWNDGAVYTRTDRRFFNDDATESAFLLRLRDAAEASGLWAELATDWMCLDCELMPWSSKGQELLRQQYAPVGNSGVQELRAEQAFLAKAAERTPGPNALQQKSSQRLDALNRYVREYRRYYWPVNSLDDLKVAPFHLLASEGAVHNLQEKSAIFSCRLPTIPWGKRLKTN